MSLTLVQRLALQKWLSERLTALRTEELVPEAQATLTVGERAAVKFGPDPASARLAAWIGMPRPRKFVKVTDEAKLLAWARDHVPHQVQVVDEVIVSGSLVDYLAEHAPQYLRQTERVDPQWVEDALKGLKDRGRVVDYNGEPWAEVPGIVKDESESVPTVSLTDDAGVILAEAWRNGDLSMPELLALPAGEVV